MKCSEMVKTTVEKVKTRNVSGSDAFAAGLHFLFILFDTSCVRTWMATRYCGQLLP